MVNMQPITAPVTPTIHILVPRFTVRILLFHDIWNSPLMRVGPPNIGEWSPPRTEPMTTDDHWDGTCHHQHPILYRYYSSLDLLDYHYQQPEIPMYDLSGQRGEDIHVDVDGAFVVMIFHYSPNSQSSGA